MRRRGSTRRTASRNTSTKSGSLDFFLVGGTSYWSCCKFWRTLRGKICDELEDFMLEGDREKFSRELTDAEDWLYEDGEFADKKTYT